jgi:hypothetical protein
MRYLDNVYCAIEFIENTQRQTGRTTRLIKALKTGDTVVAHNTAWGREIQKLAKRDGKIIKILSAVTWQEAEKKLQERGIKKAHFDDCFLFVAAQNAIVEANFRLSRLSATDTYMNREYLRP